MMRPMRFATLLVVLAGLLAGQEPAEEGPRGWAFQRPTFSFGTDLTTHYFFRGFLQENRQAITQPWAEVGFGFYEGEGTVTSVGVNFSQWNSFHCGPTGSDGFRDDPKAWYEADYVPGVRVTLWDELTLGLDYAWYTSPNDSFATAEEVVFSVSWDDARFWREELGAPADFGGLQPGLVMTQETHSQADCGSRAGQFLGLGIEPSWTFAARSSWPVTVSLPLSVGLSVHDYYECEGVRDTLGFVDVGLAASLPLQAAGGEFGAWSLSAALHLIHLTDLTASVNGGDEFELYGSVGFSVSF